MPRRRRPRGCAWAKNRSEAAVRRLREGPLPVQDALPSDGPRLLIEPTASVEVETRGELDGSPWAGHERDIALLRALGEERPCGPRPPDGPVRPHPGRRPGRPATRGADGGQLPAGVTPNMSTRRSMS